MSTSILEAFAKTPAGLALVAERERETLAKRKALVAEAVKLCADHAKASPTLRATEATAEQAVIVGRDALAKAEAALREARDAMYGAIATFDGSVARLEDELRRSAPESIAAFLDELLDLAAETRAPAVMRTLSTLGPPRNGHREETTVSNVLSIRARLDAIRRAREAAESLQLEALPVADAERRISEIRRSIPAIGEELV